MVSGDSSVPATTSPQPGLKRSRCVKSNVHWVHASNCWLQCIVRLVKAYVYLLHVETVKRVEQFVQLPVGQ